MRSVSIAAISVAAFLASACVSVPQAAVTASGEIKTQLQQLETQSLAVVNAYEDAVMATLVSDTGVQARYDRALQSVQSYCAANPGDAQQCGDGRQDLAVATLTQIILLAQREAVETEFNRVRTQLRTNFETTQGTQESLHAYLESAREVAVLRDGFVARVGEMVDLDIPAITSTFFNCAGADDPFESCGADS
jgi:hypothetical protein